MSDCTTISTTATESPQRNPDGTFAKGNKGGPGNSFARETAEMRRVFAECCTQEDLIAIAHVLLEKARAGDMQAIKLVLSYRLGKPAPMKCEDLEREETLSGEECRLMPVDANQCQSPLPNGFSLPSPDGFLPDQPPIPNGFLSDEPPIPNGFSEAKSPAPKSLLHARILENRLKKEKRKRQKAARRAARR